MYLKHIFIEQHQHSVFLYVCSKNSVTFSVDRSVATSFKTISFTINVNFSKRNAIFAHRQILYANMSILSQTV